MSRFVYDNDKSVNCAVSDSSEQNVNYILSDSMPKALTLDEIIVRSKCDPTLQAVMNAINTQNLNVDVSEEVDLTDHKKYISVDMRNELTSVNGQVILRGHHIVVPRSHQGPAKTKSLLRDKVWFPMMNKLCEDMLNNCSECEIATNT